MTPPRCRRAAIRHQLPGAQTRVVARRIAIVAERTYAVAQRILAHQHAIVEGKTTYQRARTDIVVPDIVANFALPFK